MIIGNFIKEIELKYKNYYFSGGILIAQSAKKIIFFLQSKEPK